MCLSHEKTHSLPDKSFGEPVDEPVQKWASLHIKFHQLSIRLDLSRTVRRCRRSTVALCLALQSG